MTLLKSLIAFACAGYLAVLAFMYVMQRRLLFFPDTQRIEPANAGLSRAQLQEIVTPDGERLVAWYVPPAYGQPLILYFHGNAGQIAGRADRFAQLTANGFGLYALSYRGYGGSTGSPSEAGLAIDAHAAYDAALATGIASQRIVLLGESLGSGVAVALAARAPVGAIVLEAPFSSVAEVAADIYWFLPVRWLIRDPFRSADSIADVSAPVLIVHGSDDKVMPIGYGEKLYALAREPKAFWRIERAGHQPLDSREVTQRMTAWISEALK